MKPAPFKYIAASSLDHALSAKTEHGDEAKFLAGGQSLLPAMNFRLARPAVVIDVNPLKDLAYIKIEDGVVRIGALTRYRDLERDAAFLKACPLFADALPHIAHPQIRNRGTIGGNLSHADPASELPALAVAMQARFRIRSASAERVISAADFFHGPLTTDIQDDEMLVEILWPRQSARTGHCFMEVARRRGDYALAGVATLLSFDDEDRCTQARIALCGVGETAMEVSDAADRLIGERITAQATADVAADVRDLIDPPGNVHGTAGYQRHVAGVLTQRALMAAIERAGHAA